MATADSGLILPGEPADDKKFTLYKDGSVRTPSGEFIGPDNPVPGLQDIAVVQDLGDDFSGIRPPEHVVRKVYNKGGQIMVEGQIGDKIVVNKITRSEAIARARALNDVIPSCKYSSDARRLGDLVEQFIKAVRKAATVDGKPYKTKVSFAGT